MSGLRDKLIHDYAGVDLESVWNVITDAIPDLEKNLLSVEKELLRTRSA